MRSIPGRREIEFASHGLLGPDVRFIVGKVEDTLTVPANLPDKIASLRLDTDWHASTKIELAVLYPRLAAGGVLILDDYGFWTGARAAVDEYFANRPMLFVPIDKSCRVGIKR